MIRTTIALALMTATAVAVTPISRAEQMAVRSGRIIGAAAGCGVAEARLVAVGRTTIDIIREVAVAPREAERARMLHERTVRETAARMREHVAECPIAIADFERAEADQP